MVKKRIYDHKKIEQKWRKVWLENELYEVDLKKAKRPFYNLMMFPYPSAEGLHVGNMYAFTGADVYGRYQRMLGNDVFEPIGLDGFGIHSENFAIKVGRHPKEHARISEENFYNQLSKIGNGYSWRHRLETYNPEYYRWTQWLFIKMFEKGLAYRGEAKVNWCPSCKTVLADEQVEGGACERCGTKVVRKTMSSWYFRITDYAEKLLENIEKIDWPEPIKTAQQNWIGKSTGVELEFKVLAKKEKIKVFTTAHDTVFGVTFMVLAPEHPDLDKFISQDRRKEVEKYVKEALNKTEQQRKLDEKHKTGVFSGGYVEHPFSGEKIPVWIADYVLMDYGTGAVMGVPGHDARDWEFAKKYDLMVRPVIKYTGKNKAKVGVKEDGFWDYSKIKENSTLSQVCDSDFLDGMSSLDAKHKLEEVIEEGKLGKKVVNFHLRDWLISRQRYWGAPIPMVECSRCGWQPLKEADLPLELPDMEDFEPEGTGKGPLAKLSDWVRVDCPRCGGEARRETDVCDTFLDSSWYFLAYPFIKDKKWEKGASPFRKEILKKWLPVDAYIGGAEHAVLHLLYSRFVAMALHDMGLVEFEEPFPYLYSHGLIIKDGTKMSKSKGNVVNPDEYIDRFGADALRCYLMFLGPYDQGGDFRDTGMVGMYRWLERLWKLFVDETKLVKKAESSKRVAKKLAVTVKKVGEDISKLRYNTAIAAMMELSNIWKEEGEVLSRSDGVRFLKLLSPLTPFMAEELYQMLEGRVDKTAKSEFVSVHLQRWPEYDKDLLVKKSMDIAIQVNGKLRDSLSIEAEKAKNEAEVEKAALTSEKVAKWLGGKKHKVIFVPGRLINLVTG